MESIIKALHCLIIETNPELRKQAEEMLQTEMKDREHFYQGSLQIISEGQGKDEATTKALRQMAASVLQQFINQQIATGLSVDHIEYYVKFLLQVLAKTLIDRSLAEKLAIILRTVLFVKDAKAGTDTLAAVEKVIPFFHEAIIVCENLETFPNILLCIQSLLLGLIPIPVASKVVEEIVLTLEKIMKRILESVVTITKKITEAKGERFDEEVQEIIPKLRVLHVWTALNKTLFENGRKFKQMFIINHCINSSETVMILSQGVQLIILAKAQRNDSLICCSGNVEYDQIANYWKIKCLEFANLVVEYIYMTPFSSKMSACPWFSFCSLNGPLCLLTLVTLCGPLGDRIEELTMISPYKEIYVQCLKLLTNMLEDNNFYSLFSCNKGKIIVEIIFMLLRITESESHSMIKDPTNFVSLAADTCENQKSEIPKVQAAKMLEALCDHIDGCLSLVALFCGECLKFACSNNKPEAMAENQVLAPFLKTSIFLQKTSPEHMVDACLLIMSDLSYLTPRRKDVFQLFESILIHHFSFFFDSSSTLIRCRVAQMLCFFADHLFHHSNELFVKTIEFLIKGIDREKEEPAFAIQSSYSLKSIIAEPELISRLDLVQQLLPFSQCIELLLIHHSTFFQQHPFLQHIKTYYKKKNNKNFTIFINQLFPNLCSMVLRLNSKSFFDILSSIVSNYSSTIDESIIQLLASLVQRVETEYKQLVLLGKKNNMVIDQCWNVICTIIEEEEFYPDHLDKFEEIILPLFNYLMRPKEIEFDDDLLQIITSLIKKREAVDENLIKLFPHLSGCFEKYKYTFGSLLQTLNAYIEYGKDQIKANKELQELLLKMAHASLFTTTEIVEFNNAEGAILFQIMFQTLGGGLMNSYISEIIPELLRRFNMGVKNDFLNRQLCNMFLCSVCNNGPLTLQLVEPQFDKLLGKILEVTPFSSNSKDSKFSHIYDLKIFIIGLGNILIHSKTNPYIVPFMPRILCAIISTMKTQAELDHKKLLKSDTKAISLDDEDDSSYSDMESESDSDLQEEEEKKEVKKSEKEDEEDSDDDVVRDPEKDILKTLSSLDCQIKKIDEYTYMHKIINLLYTQDAEMMKGLQQTFPKQAR